jgi:hypothetical protein
MQTEDVQRQVLLFLERLRAVRHKPARDLEDLRQTALATPRQQARRMLDRPITVNFHEPTPLAKILAFLSEATDSDILIDHVALAAAESSDRVEATLATQQKALGAALTDLLGPLGLTYRVVGAQALQVTTREGSDQRLDCEFYRIAPLIAKGIAPAKLIERLKARVAPSTWSDVGGPAEIGFDPPSACLIVLQSQSVQERIERLLKRAAGTGQQ